MTVSGEPDDDRSADAGKKPTPVIPVLPPPDERLPYNRPANVPLRQQVAQILALAACVTCAMSWLLEAAYFVANSNAAGVGCFAMMAFTGLLVFLCDAASVTDSRPRLWNYAVFGTIGCILFFSAIEIIRR